MWAVHSPKNISYVREVSCCKVILRWSTFCKSNINLITYQHRFRLIVKPTLISVVVRRQKNDQQEGTERPMSMAERMSMFESKPSGGRNFGHSPTTNGVNSKRSSWRNAPPQVVSNWYGFSWNADSALELLLIVNNRFSFLDCSALRALVSWTPPSSTTYSTSAQVLGCRSSWLW